MFQVGTELNSDENSTAQSLLSTPNPEQGLEESETTLPWFAESLENQDEERNEFQSLGSGSLVFNTQTRNTESTGTDSGSGTGSGIGSRKGSGTGSGQVQV